jgi:hypothetical protein
MCSRSNLSDLCHCDLSIGFDDVAAEKPINIPYGQKRSPGYISLPCISIESAYLLTELVLDTLHVIAVALIP